WKWRNTNRKLFKYWCTWLVIAWNSSVCISPNAGKRQEGGNVDPILPYTLLKKPTYAVTMLLALMSGTFIGAVIFIPSFAEQVIGIPDAKSGYWMTPLALASGIGAGGGGFFVDKRGPVQTL